MILSIKNDRANIVEMNYWDTDHARNGYLFLSWNARAARLLMPDALKGELKAMRGAREVIISRGPMHDQDAYELMFEDGSDNPYAMHVGLSRSDRVLPASEHGRSFIFTVWTREGEQLRLPARYRIVATLPCLDSWNE